ncbi:hypothetical protein MYX06_03090 [Patescibacteria group bacterium AH-259-L05]|nr:hypothetical protein [Patescibacteria group bacterium AH-259-L05]
MLTQKTRRAQTVEQQKRLINRDFPWMWALMNHWRFGLHTIYAGYPDSSLINTLSGPCVDKHWHGMNYEYWIRCVWPPRVSRTSVEKVVRLKSISNRSWAQCIIEEAKGMDVLNIVKVFYEGIDNGDEEIRKVFNIYRPSKGDKSFDPLLYELMCQSR